VVFTGTLCVYQLDNTKDNCFKPLLVLLSQSLQIVFFNIHNEINCVRHCYKLYQQIYTSLLLSLFPFDLHTPVPAQKSQTQPVLASQPPHLKFNSCLPMHAKSTLNELFPVTRRYHVTRAKSKLAPFAK